MRHRGDVQAIRERDRLESPRHPGGGLRGGKGALLLPSVWPVTGGAGVPSRALTDLRASFGQLPLEDRFIAAVARRRSSRRIRPRVRSRRALGSPFTCWQPSRARDGVMLACRLLARSCRVRLRRLVIEPGPWRARFTGSGGPDLSLGAGPSEARSSGASRTARPAQGGGGSRRHRGRCRHVLTTTDGVGAQLRAFTGCTRCPARSTSSTSTRPSGRCATRGSCRCSRGVPTRISRPATTPSSRCPLTTSTSKAASASGSTLAGTRSSDTGSTRRRRGARCCCRRTMPTATWTGTRRPIRRCARSAPTADTGRRGPSACASTCAAGICCQVDRRTAALAAQQLLPARLRNGAGGAAPAGRAVRRAAAHRGAAPTLHPLPGHPGAVHRAGTAGDHRPGGVRAGGFRSAAELGNGAQRGAPRGAG